MLSPNPAENSTPERVQVAGRASARADYHAPSPASRAPVRPSRRYAPVGTGSRPSSGAHHQSNLPDGESSAVFLPKNSRLCPSGAQIGSRAVRKPSATRVGGPPLAGTVNTENPGARAPAPESQGPVQYAMRLPLGEKRGRRPSLSHEARVAAERGIT